MMPAIANCAGLEQGPELAAISSSSFRGEPVVQAAAEMRDDAELARGSWLGPICRLPSPTVEARMLTAGREMQWPLRGWRMLIVEFSGAASGPVGPL